MELTLALVLLIISVVLAVLRRDWNPSLFALWAIAVALILRGAILAIK